MPFLYRNFKQSQEIFPHNEHKSLKSDPERLKKHQEETEKAEVNTVNILDGRARRRSRPTSFRTDLLDPSSDEEQSVEIAVEQPSSLEDSSLVTQQEEPTVSVDDQEKLLPPVSKNYFEERVKTSESGTK